MQLTQERNASDIITDLILDVSGGDLIHEDVTDTDRTLKKYVGRKRLVSFCLEVRSAFDELKLWNGNNPYQSVAGLLDEMRGDNTMTPLPRTPKDQKAVMNRIGRMRRSDLVRFVELKLTKKTNTGSAIE